MRLSKLAGRRAAFTPLKAPAGTVRREFLRPPVRTKHLATDRAAGILRPPHHAVPTNPFRTRHRIRASSMSARNPPCGRHDPTVTQDSSGLAFVT